MIALYILWNSSAPASFGTDLVVDFEYSSLALVTATVFVVLASFQRRGFENLIGGLGYRDIFRDFHVVGKEIVFGQLVVVRSLISGLHIDIGFWSSVSYFWIKWAARAGTGTRNAKTRAKAGRAAPAYRWFGNSELVIR